MKIKQKALTFVLAAVIMSALSVFSTTTTYALTKNQFLSVLCDALEGPNAKENCYKEGKDGTVTTYNGVTFKLSDYTDMTEAEFRTEVEKKSGADTTPPTASTDGCAGVETSIIKCDAANGGDLKDNGVWALLLIAINILTAGIGIAAVGGIVYGAVLYTSAGDKAEQVKKAIGIITNVVIGVLAYVAMYALLQFLIPGGVFS